MASFIGYKKSQYVECERPPFEQDNQDYERQKDIYEQLGGPKFTLHKELNEKDLIMQGELTDASAEELKKLDTLTDAQIESIQGFEQKEEEYIIKGGARFRKIDILTEDMLKNGMKVQIGICSPADPSIFGPLDKILIYNKAGKYYATGSF